MFVAHISQPGYLPDAEPVEFETASEAWAYLADERRTFETNDDEFMQLAQYSHAVDALNLLRDGEIDALRGLYLAAGADFAYGINADLTGHLAAPTTLDPESHKLPEVYVVDIMPDSELAELEVTEERTVGASSQAGLASFRQTFPFPPVPPISH